MDPLTGCLETSDCSDGTFCINSFCVDHSFYDIGQKILIEAVESRTDPSEELCCFFKHI